MLIVTYSVPGMLLDAGDGKEKKQYFFQVTRQENN
jgi:hypothetical protein